MTKKEINKNVTKNQYGYWLYTDYINNIKLRALYCSKKEFINKVYKLYK